MKISNLELIQSYVFTAAKYDFSAYEKRIMYCIIRLLQAEIEGKKLNERYDVQTDLFQNKVVTIPIIDCLSENDKNHFRIKEALRSLRNKTFEYEDDKEWKLIGVIEMPKVKKYSETIQFTLPPEIVSAFLNFSKGFRKYIFEIAMNFESIYAMRFYELFSNKLEPITYSIDYIKKIFSIEDKYKLTADFKRYVLDVAKREMDSKSPFSFSYKMIKTGRKETHILFAPYKIKKNQPIDIERKELSSKISPYWTVSPELITLLKKYFDYDTELIKKHKRILELVTEHLDFKPILNEILLQIEGNDAINSLPAYLYGVFRNKLKSIGISLEKDIIPKDNEINNSDMSISEQEEENIKNAIKDIIKQNGDE